MTAAGCTMVAVYVIAAIGGVFPRVKDGQQAEIINCSNYLKI